jgi:ABC-type multidrug transport system fused ATPase/permease subunit
VNSPLLITATLLSFITANGAQLFQQFIIARWTELDQGILAPVVTRKYLNLLMYAATVSSVFLWLRSFLLMLAGTRYGIQYCKNVFMAFVSKPFVVRASTYLYNKLLSSVFRAPIMFFDSTPSGQLLSRFGREMDVVDRSVPDGIGSVLFCFLQISLSIMALAGAVTPFMLVPLFGIGTMYTGIMSRFRPAARKFWYKQSCSSTVRLGFYTSSSTFLL